MTRISVNRHAQYDLRHGRWAGLPITPHPRTYRVLIEWGESKGQGQESPSSQWAVGGSFNRHACNTSSSYDGGFASLTCTNNKRAMYCHTHTHTHTHTLTRTCSHIHTHAHCIVARRTQRTALAQWSARRRKGCLQRRECHTGPLRRCRRQGEPERGWPWPWCAEWRIEQHFFQMICEFANFRILRNASYCGLHIGLSCSSPIF
jgi:hypothetical protein